MEVGCVALSGADAARAHIHYVKCDTRLCTSSHLIHHLIAGGPGSSASIAQSSPANASAGVNHCVSQPHAGDLVTKPLAAHFMSPD